MTDLMGETQFSQQFKRARYTVTYETEQLRQSHLQTVVLKV